MKPERECCHAVAALLAAHGVNEVVISPGSRNAPLIEAIDSVKNLHTTIVIDERSAAFVALGKASITQHCVALVCTSGTAMLNYAPALAEANYRNLPLLVLTADRQHELINRNDGQTIVQPDSYGRYIKQWFNLDCRDNSRFRDIIINDAVNSAMQLPYGPVHLNIEIPDPSLDNNESEETSFTEPQAIECIGATRLLSRDKISELASRLQSPTRVMIVAGCNNPDNRLNRAILKLCSCGNFICLADSISNLHGHGIINFTDTILSELDKKQLDLLKPDIVLSHGGAILSTTLKKYLRDNMIEHWHIGLTTSSQDTFGSMTLRIETQPSVFYRQLAVSIKRNGGTDDYTSRWILLAKHAVESAKTFIENSPWCDLKAVCRIMSMTPQSYNIQLSNGMSVRYAQVLSFKHHRVDCNRGVSGIEGSTSTAIGASTMYHGNTLLITGDMSAEYDLNALLLQCKSPRFKMVVVMNGGGGIFNYIKGTRDFKEVDRYMVVKQNLPIENIANAAGFKVFVATDETELNKHYRMMLAENKMPALLVIKTSSADSAYIMRQFIKRKR